MRFSEILYRAREVMFAADLHSLPINPFSVCSNFYIQVVSYTEARRYGFTEIIEKINHVDVDGFCYKGAGNNYIIFYDDARTPKARINFTIAHELGHIALGHLKNVGMRPRYMTNRKNDPLEKDADTFAGELIRPPIPFVFTDCTRIDDIQSVCSITYEAATVCSKLVQKMQEQRDNPYYFNDFQFYHKQFFNFIYAKYCGPCRNFFIDASAKFCPVCGNSHMWWFNERLPLISMISDTTKGDLIVRYKEYATSDNKQLLKCIRCDNEDIRPEDQFCKICKAPLYNRCVGIYVEDSPDESYLDRSQSCGKLLPANARFCTACGGVSAFYHAGLLPHWETELHDLLEQPDLSELPEPPPIDFLD